MRRPPSLVVVQPTRAEARLRERIKAENLESAKCHRAAVRTPPPRPRGKANALLVAQQLPGSAEASAPAATAAVTPLVAAAPSAAAPPPAPPVVTRSPTQPTSAVAWSLLDREVRVRGERTAAARRQYESTAEHALKVQSELEELTSRVAGLIGEYEGGEVQGEPDVEDGVKGSIVELLVAQV